MGLLIASLVLIGVTLIGVIVGRIAYSYCVEFDNTDKIIEEEIKTLEKPRETLTFRCWFNNMKTIEPNKYTDTEFVNGGTWGSYVKRKSIDDLQKEYGKEYEKVVKELRNEQTEYNKKVAEIKQRCTEKYKNCGKANKRKYVMATVLYSFISFAWLIILLFGAFCKVNANEVGIIYDDRYGVMERVKYEGFQMKSIFEHITTISTQNRSARLETTGQTSDGQYGTFQLSLIYRIDRKDAGMFYKKTNASDISSEALNTIVKSCLQSSTINYDIFELLSTKLEVARVDFREDLADELMDKYFITLVDVSFDDVDAGEKVEEILKAKAESLQRIEIAERQAEADLITAENKAEIERTLADAEAYALKTVGGAKGEAEQAYIDKVKGMIDNLSENSTLSYKECTDIVLGIVFYDTWDGKLPEVLTSDSLSGMIGGLISNNP